MEPRRIHTIADLREFLEAAVQLELAVIPPYMCALYSIVPETNQVSTQIIRSVIVEEMLHLINAANTLNAVQDGHPVVVGSDVVPKYPTLLPDGEKGFKVHLDPFSATAIETFLKIEYPSRPHAPEPMLKVREEREATPLKVTGFGHKTVGEFYEEIIRGIDRVVAEFGEKEVFPERPDRQITSAYYYAGGGDPVAVYGSADAKRAINEVIDQGEGLTHSLFDNDGDLGHYFRYDQIQRRRRYQAGDLPDHPTGAPMDVAFEQVYPMQRDPRMEDYPQGELRDRAVAFNVAFSELLRKIQAAFDGAPEQLLPAVGLMFDIRYTAVELMKNPLPGTGFNAGPTFEYVEKSS
jgi:hypothetical protein